MGWKQGVYVCIFCVYVHVGRWVCTWYRGQIMGIQFLLCHSSTRLFKIGSLAEPRVHWLARLTGQQTGNPHHCMPSCLLPCKGDRQLPCHPCQAFLCECWESKLSSPYFHHSSFAEYHLPSSQFHPLKHVEKDKNILDWKQKSL